MKWKVVPEYPHLEASDTGLMRNAADEKIRKPTLDRIHGYYMLSVSGGCAKNVHSLVASAFLGPRPHKNQVRHLDGDKLNNSIANLKYGTQAENEQDKLRHGRDQRGERHWKCILTERAVRAIRRRYRFGNAPKLAAEFGVKPRHIRAVASGKVWSWL